MATSVMKKKTSIATQTATTQRQQHNYNTIAHLVMVMACIAATTIVAAAAADSSTGRRQSAGSLHGTARLLEGEGSRGLWRRVMDVVDKVVGVAVAVAVTVAVLGANGLLRGRRLQAARMGVAQRQVTGGRPSTRGVLLTAGWQSGHGRASVFSRCARQSRSAVIW